jgi:glycosyltransferase involved in cell wall biosynthesis
MRILIVNDGFGDAGGVQTYLDAMAGGLAERGHELVFLHGDAAPAPFAQTATRGIPRFAIAAGGIDATLDRIGRWGPDLCFSHNMSTLDIDRGLIARWPVVKFMHGYFGTCIGGQKRHGFPAAQPCDRRFGTACLALYGPRHCGKLRFGTFVSDYRWARQQHDLVAGYRAIVVASEHMKREFVRNGVQPSQVHANPLFPTHMERPDRRAEDPAYAACEWTVAFVGRMTVLKGGDLLVDAIARASGQLGRSIRLLMIGDGPQRTAWEQRASRLGVPYTATGWLSGADRWTALRQATVLALPSTWPEPFGLVGLEAAALGIPAVAFDVGGVREWLRPGVNGHLAPADPPRASGLADSLVRTLSDAEQLNAMRQGAVAIAAEMSLARHLDRLEAVFALHALPHAHSAGR